MDSPTDSLIGGTRIPGRPIPLRGGQKDLKGIARVRRRRRGYASNEDYVTTTPHGAYR
jgi:hypothetical protein